jgi:hypothetical protein
MSRRSSKNIMSGRSLWPIMAAVAVAATAASTAAPSAAAASHRAPKPAIASRADQFEGISCTTAHGCLAVGSQFSSATKEIRALGETRKPGGTTWAVHDPAPTTGATNTAFGPFGNGETVSCVSSPSAMCMGIGSYNNSAGQFNYAARWDWSAWKVVNPPNPSPTLSSGLDAVRCLSSNFCLTIGHWIDSATGKDALESLTWNGKSWAMTKKMPVVPASAASGVRLWGLSCVSTTWCMAVGDYNVSASEQLLLSEVWNGKAWTMNLPPNPPGSSAHALVGVSCVSTKFCAAVGDSLSKKLAFVSLGESWNGTSWTIHPTPKSKQTIGSELFDVSCLSAKFCLSLGDLAAVWNGTAWVGKPFPVPAHTSLANAVSVSCLSPKDCTGAGGYSTKAGTLTMVWNWNGKSLSLQSAQNP